MRMRSVLALSALSAATFLAGAAFAADAQTANKTVEKAQTQVQQQAAQPTKAQAAQPDTAVKAEHKKHHAHKHHRHHKKHHRHHRHHHRHHQEHAYAPAPTWNFLLGGSLGYVAQKEQFITRFVSSALLPGLLSPFQYRDHEVKITEQGVLFGLLAGWQWHYNRWMLGAEAGVDFGSFEKDRQFSYTDLYTPQSIVGTVLYDRGDIYTISGRAGYFVTPFFMPYVRLGVQGSRDEVNYQVLVNTSSGAAPDFSSKEKDVYGFVAGIGAEFPTYIGSSTIRFEYNFVRTESVIIEDNTFPVIGNHKFRYPESHIGKIAWVWNFM